MTTATARWEPRPEAGEFTNVHITTSLETRHKAGRVVSAARRLAVLERPSVTPAVREDAARALDELEGLARDLRQVLTKHPGI